MIGNSPLVLRMVKMDPDEFVDRIRSVPRDARASREDPGCFCNGGFVMISTEGRIMQLTQHSRCIQSIAGINNRVVMIVCFDDVYWNI